MPSWLVAHRRPPLRYRRDQEGHDFAGGRGAASGVRLSVLSRPAGGDCRPGRWRRRRPGTDADRWRQVALLSDSGPLAARRRGGRFAADRPDAGSGRRLATSGRQGCFPQFLAGLPGGGRYRAQPVARRTRSHLCRPRTAADGPFHRSPRTADRPPASGPVRHRRGALRFAVGPRLSPRVHPTLPVAPTFSRHTAHCADGDGRPTDAAGNQNPARARRSTRVRRQFRSAQYPLLHCRARQSAPAVARVSRRARERSRDRLLPVTAQGRRNGRLAERAGGARLALPRRIADRRPPAASAALPARGWPGDGRHHRLRHGHRQAGRAFRRPPRSAA